MIGLRPGRTHETRALPNASLDKRVAINSPGPRANIDHYMKGANHALHHRYRHARSLAAGNRQLLHHGRLHTHSAGYCGRGRIDENH